MTQRPGRARNLSFGAAAAAYERGRPSYPDAAIRWLLPHGARRVVDLGAGTGKLTRRLRDFGIDVVAVEPSPGMRDQLRESVPGVEVHAGTAEAIPLADASADVVLAAQSWHWVDPARAVPEVARVLAPGGWLGLVWNVRDERDSWVAALSEIMHRHGARDEEDVEPTIGAPFGPMERLHVGWTYHLSRAAVVDLVASRSYIITMPPAQRAAVLSDVRRLADSRAAQHDADSVAIPYITHCSRTRLL